MNESMTLESACGASDGESPRGKSVVTAKVGEEVSPKVTARLAERISRLAASPIRDILKVANRADVVSFAGGLPDGESFPDLSLETISQQALQYGPTEGEEQLRDWIAEDLTKRGLSVAADCVLILSGSQQGIDLVAKMFVSDKTKVAVESPTYLAALQVFNLFGADYTSFCPQSSDKLVDGSPALTYCIPTFQNPTSYCYTKAERQRLASACDASGSVLLEDDPYRDLVYDQCDRQPVCSYLKRSEWIYQSSFSKTLAPGLRLGYLVCSPSLYPTLSWLKQAADLHSNRLSQQLVLSLLQGTDYEARLGKLIVRYRKKRDHFEALLQEHFSDIASWTVPAGGLFFWLKLHSARAIDTRELLQEAIARGVAFMPGEPFFSVPRDAASHIRLNFSNASAQQSSTGVKILADLFRSH